MNTTDEAIQDVTSMPEELSNDQRAAFAGIAVDAYHLRTRHELGPEHGDIEEWEETMSDLLCDLRHLSDQRGLDWDAIVRRGQAHYADEVGA